MSAADVVVLAGDIHVGTAGVEWARRHFGGKTIIYLAGNHEFYGGHWEKTLGALRKATADAGITFLEDDEIVIHNVRFLGCTLWTDFAYFGGGERQRQAMADYEDGLVDCRAIKGVHPRLSVLGGGQTTRRLTPLHVLRRHHRSREWLEQKLAEYHHGRTVVVTHHLPHRGSVAARFANDRLTPGFAVDLPISTIVKADVWIHGHTHDSCAYRLRDGDRECLVVCNPLGYPLPGGRMENGRFDPMLTIEVGEEVKLRRSVT